VRGRSRLRLARRCFLISRALANFSQATTRAFGSASPAPKQTPNDIVELLNKEINAGLANPALSARLSDIGGTPLKGSSADFKKLFIGDSEKWTKLMRAANVKAE